MLNNKVILVTGGTGSFGRKFVEKILVNYDVKKIIIFSRDELKQLEMSQSLSKFKDKTRYLIGDIRDEDRLDIALQGVDIVIHAAALKQVPTAEYNPFEVIKTNIIGSKNIIESSMRNQVKNVVALSTDKAASPINLYGATKLTSDKLFIAANNYKGWNDIKFSVVRYGNVMGSRGSVIPHFINQKNDGVLDITDERMTRFNITLSEGVDFVIQCLNKMWGGEIFVPKLPSYRILDVASAIAPKAKINIINIRPGEKIHELMISESDAINTVEFEDYYVILPNSEYISWNSDDYFKEHKSKNIKRCPDGFSYSSEHNSDFLSIQKIRDLIDKNL